jgi:hypothetical protein
MISDNILKDKITLALSSKDVNTLTNLAKDLSYRVRRAVARNDHTPSSILGILAFDPVANVSFKAVEHKNCEIKRSFNDYNHPCICCNLNEANMDCNACKKINEFNCS